jgi:hypothetical protein
MCVRHVSGVAPPVHAGSNSVETPIVPTTAGRERREAGAVVCFGIVAHRSDKVRHRIRRRRFSACKSSRSSPPWIWRPCFLPLFRRNCTRWRSGSPAAPVVPHASGPSNPSAQSCRNSRRTSCTELRISFHVRGCSRNSRSPAWQGSSIAGIIGYVGNRCAVIEPRGPEVFDGPHLITDLHRVIDVPIRVLHGFRRGPGSAGSGFPQRV